MIAVLGEALVDLIVDSAGNVSASPGGAPYNAARACARLGADVAFHGPLSTDRLGELLAAQLAADGVSVARAPRPDAPTTLAVAELGNGAHARYRFYAAGTSVTAAAVVPIPDGEHVLYTGGLALVLEPMASAIDAALAIEQPGRRVYVDVNCRSAAIDDRRGYTARAERIAACADVVKVSDEDLAYLYPGAAPLDAAATLLRGRTRAVLATFGADGSVVITADEVTRIPAGESTVVDTIGAGDGFSAGFVTWWTETRAWRFEGSDYHASVVEAARAAAMVAAAVCSRRGATPPLRTELGAPWNAPPLDATPTAFDR
jgi:fructokinase